MSRTAAAAKPSRTKSRRPYTPRMPLPLRRQQILDAALTIIVRDGYRAVSIDAIARELDVTRPVIYNAFDDLEQLLHTLLDRQAQRAMAQLGARLTGSIPLPPRTRADLYDLVVDLATMVTEDPVTWGPILLASLDTPQPVRDRIDREREAARLQFKAILDATLIRSGATDLDSEMLAHALLALAMHFGRLLIEGVPGITPQRIAATLTALMPG
jgi:AcrR family transcriptional regulator